MNATDCATFREQIELEVDGRLGGEQELALDRHAAACAACREERRELEALRRALERSRAGVRRGFAAEVMERLPAAGWEGSAPRAWRLPAAVLAALAAAAAALVGLSSAQLHPGVPFLGALAAVADMAQTAALAGAGLLTASWRGIGLAVSELLSGSPGTLVAFAVVVLAVDLLLLALVRRRRPAAETSVRGNGAAGDPDRR